jgi:hypothetical protein
MRSLISRYLALAALAALLAAVPAAVLGAATGDEPATQTNALNDSRTGSGPCGFPVRRDIAGTVELTPRIDAAGNLVLAIEHVDLGGRLTNPANGKAIELRWVKQNGATTFRADGVQTSLALALTGYFMRGGEDPTRSDLAMDLPADGAPLIDFEPGAGAEEPWAHVCGLLA